MKNIINDSFLLHNNTAYKLYHEHAANLPIIDYHNHLNPYEIYMDKSYANLTDVWLGGDHYKWRAMRAMGYSEELVTGISAYVTMESTSEVNAEKDFKRFLAYADTVQNSFGNPLYHWTHLELKRYFDIDEALDTESAEDIWNRCNELLGKQEYSTRNLLRMQNVKVLCTTDDPVDDLQWHQKLKEELPDISVRPSFRPGSVLDIEKSSFAEYISRLAQVTGTDINDLPALLQAVKMRLEFFIENGCRVSDHSLELDFYREADYGEVSKVFDKALRGENVSLDEAAMYRGYILTELGKMYADNDIVMQLHIGAIRNNSTRMFERLGADTGFDSINDFNYAPQLSALLNAMDRSDQLPKTILYYLNPKDTAMLMTMAGNYQGNSKGIRGKVQLGSAWWFNDHKTGMEQQLQALCDMGMLSNFVGMLTDSRSFLSFPRHEYFRRILCNMIGEKVEAGEYPADTDFLGQMVENICCYNAVKYFGLKI